MLKKQTNSKPLSVDDFDVSHGFNTKMSLAQTFAFQH